MQFENGSSTLFASFSIHIFEENKKMANTKYKTLRKISSKKKRKSNSTNHFDLTDGYSKFWE